MTRVAYSSPCLSVTDATIPGDNSVVVITFPARTERQGLHREGFGAKFFAKEGVSTILIKAEWNHWFQVPEWPDMIAAVREIAARFDRVIVYGSSMGGYGATLISGAVGADTIIAVSPQFSIEAGKVPFEKRWREDADRITFRHDDLHSAVNHDARLILIYDPAGPDRRHGDLFDALPCRVERLTLPFAGHPAGAFLRDTKMISKLIRSIVANDFDPRRWRSSARDARRNSALYWSNLAAAVRGRWPRLATFAARRAVEIDPANPMNHFQLARVLVRAGDLAGARPAIGAAIEINPNVKKFHAMVAEIEARSPTA